MYSCLIHVHTKNDDIVRKDKYRQPLLLRILFCELFVL